MWATRGQPKHQYDALLDSSMMYPARTSSKVDRGSVVGEVKQVDRRRSTGNSVGIIWHNSPSVIFALVLLYLCLK
jgi:hypothetical protein